MAGWVLMLMVAALVGATAAADDDEPPPPTPPPSPSPSPPPAPASERPPRPALGYSSCTCQEEAAGGGAGGEGGEGVDGVEGVEVTCNCSSAGSVVVQRDVQSLTVSDLKRATLGGEALRLHADSLRDLFLTEAADLRVVEEDVLRGLHHLRTFDITEAPLLSSLPDSLLEGVSRNFRTLRVVRTGLLEVPRLQWTEGEPLHMLDLESNRIRELHSNNLQVKAELVILSYNAIEQVEGWAFNGSLIAKLSLRGNRGLRSLAADAFAGLRGLHDLDLSETAIAALPTRGLQSLEVLRVQGTASLTVIPSIYNFQHLREAWLTYSFHCCAFRFPERHDPRRHALHQEYEAAARRRCRQNASTPAPTSTPAPATPAAPAAPSVPARARRALRRLWGLVYDGAWMDEDADFLNDGSFAAAAASAEDDDRLRNDAFDSDDEDDLSSSEEEEEEGAGWHALQPAGEGEEDGPGAWAGRHHLHHHEHLDSAEAEAEGASGVFHHTTLRPRRRHHLCGNLSVRAAVRCRPEPDAFNPCEDIMGSSWLRACVWLVLVTAVLGNAAVLAGLLVAPRHLTPGNFLMCNLALADLCMGLYLLLLAAADAHSQGVYFNFAYYWQRGPGCQAAGFLTVFASQLSVYTLAVLTLERWVAITYALYLNKRLKLRAAVYIMAAGWAYALGMAALPLLGVSSYATTSICLPMEASRGRDVAYLSSLLAADALAFGAVVVCYVRMYLSLGRDTRRSAMRRGELTVAKRMALLVFTDFACWAPISFFALTAVAGYPLIDVTRSKILLVFFYPLNSCANPYLYALLTKQYRRDVRALLARHGLWRRASQHFKGAYSSPTSNQNPQHVLHRQHDTSATGMPSTTTAHDEASV